MTFLLQRAKQHDVTFQHPYRHLADISRVTGRELWLTRTVTVGSICYCFGPASRCIMAGLHDGPEYGREDFVLLDNVEMGPFMKNLKLR